MANFIGKNANGDIVEISATGSGTTGDPFVMQYVVDMATAPLPTGASTEAKQDTAQTALSAIQTATEAGATQTTLAAVEALLEPVAASLSEQTYYNATVSSSGDTVIAAAAADSFVIDYIKIQPTPAASVTVLIKSGGSTIWSMAFDATNLLAYAQPVRFRLPAASDITINMSTADPVGVGVVYHAE